jgi:hypothetical protein
MLIDNSKAWVLTQSFKDFAVRAPASIFTVDAETAKLKVTAYADLWAEGSAVSAS